MKNKLSCEIVRDLLPLYVDELTSKVSNEAVEEHLAECKECISAYNAMKMPEGDSAGKVETEEIKEIDFLKKTHKKNKNLILGSVVGTAIIACMVVFLIRFVFGFNMKISTDSWIIPEAVEQGNISIEANPSDDSIVVCSYSVKEESEGVFRIDYKCKKKLFDSTENTKYVFDGSKKINEIWMGDDIVWKSGVRISKMTSDVWSARHPYMGDAAANVRTADALRFTEKYGSFKNELDSSGDRLVWHIELDNKMKSELAGSISNKLKAYGYVMLATIDNLDEVEFKWYDEDDSHFLTVKVCKEDVISLITKSEASDEEYMYHAVTDLKEVGEDIASLQLLINGLGL